MTVSDLIAFLKMCPPDARVCIDLEYACPPISAVTPNNDGDMVIS